MGAHDLTATLPGGLNIDAVKRHFEQWKAEDAQESGSGAYAGNWTTFPGLEFKSTLFQDEEAAREYILDYHEKRESAIAVRYKHVEVTVTRAPTFNGKEAEDIKWANGERKCFAVEYGAGMTKTFVPADQLTEPQKARCLKLLEAARKIGLEETRARNWFAEIVATFQTDPEWWDARALKKAKSDHFKAKAAAQKAGATLREFNERMCRKLYKEKKENGQTKWLVGGWAAS